MKRIAAIVLLLVGCCWGADVILGVGSPTSWGGSGADRYAVWSGGAAPYTGTWPTNDPLKALWVRAWAMPWQGSNSVAPQVDDASGNGNGLTLASGAAAPTFTAKSGINAPYWTFDGGDWMGSGSNTFGTLAITQGTICVWTRMSSSTPPQAFLSTAHTNTSATSYSLFGEYTGSLPRWYCGDPADTTVDASGSYVYTANEWYFLAFTCDGVNATNSWMYAATAAYGWNRYSAYSTRSGTKFLQWPLAAANQHQVLTVGALRYANAGSTIWQLNGRISRLAIYNRPLTTNELYQMFLYTHPTNTTEVAP